MVHDFFFNFWGSVIDVRINETTNEVYHSLDNRNALEHKSKQLESTHEVFGLLNFVQITFKESDCFLFVFTKVKTKVRMTSGA